jgi:S-(hydroxymethyl)glutathione dehydrogenase/alcohol dehydrogenase
MTATDLPAKSTPSCGQAPVCRICPANVSIPGISGRREADSDPLAMMQKRIQGNVYGGWSPRVAVPILLDMYKNKKLKLDELITRKYKIDEINEAYDDMRNGKNIRGVILHEH